MMTMARQSTLCSACPLRAYSNETRRETSTTNNFVSLLRQVLPQRLEKHIIEMRYQAASQQRVIQKVSLAERRLLLQSHPHHSGSCHRPFLAFCTHSSKQRSFLSERGVCSCSLHDKSKLDGGVLCFLDVVRLSQIFSFYIKTLLL